MFELWGIFHCPFHFPHVGTPFNLASEQQQRQELLSPPSLALSRLMPFKLRAYAIDLRPAPSLKMYNGLCDFRTSTFLATLGISYK